MLASKKDIIANLQKNILQWQGFKVPLAGSTRFTGLESIESTFPNEIFPTGALHEFLIEKAEYEAASAGFINGLLSQLMQQGGICLWISTSRALFPPALKVFGVHPERFIFIDLKRERDILWATEEALKCKAISAVIAEVQEISFAESRRLQLVVEKSRVTGFILRKNIKKLSTTACAARWKITPLPSVTPDGLPGLGFPRWNVELLKVRNGNPGAWKIEWQAGRFAELPQEQSITIETRRLKTG